MNSGQGRVLLPTIMSLIRTMYEEGQSDDQIYAALSHRSKRTSLAAMMSMVRKSSGMPKRRSGGFHPRKTPPAGAHLFYEVAPRADIRPAPRRRVIVRTTVGALDLGDPPVGRSAFAMGRRPGDALLHVEGLRV